MIGFTDEEWPEDDGYSTGHGQGLHGRAIRRRMPISGHITYKERAKMRRRK